MKYLSQRHIIAAAIAAIAVAGTLPAFADGVSTPSNTAGNASAGATAGVSDVSSSAYVLSPDDQLNISVLNHADVSQNVVVLPDGTIRFPIVGSVHAAGMTVSQLTKVLTDGLSTDFNQPQVTVTVVQTKPRDCSILGAVRSPGLYPVKPGTTLLNVLAAAGGLAQLPVLTTATLVTEGGAKSETLDISSLMAGTDPQQNYPMQSGDVVLVQAKDPSAGEVQVIGEVLKPGSYDVPADGMTISTLLAETGGAAPDGALTQAQLMEDGHATPLNLHPLMDNLNDPVGQTLVMPGDVLLVPKDNNYVGILGEVRQPARYEIPDGRTLTVTEAVSLAGGPTTDAIRNHSEIIRQEPDGQPKVIPINIDHLLAGQGTSGDVALRNGDILYIPTRRHGSPFNPFNLIGQLPYLAYIIPKL